MSAVKAAFLPDTITVPLERLLPSRTLHAGIKETNRYKVIASSVREVGIIEPVVVHSQNAKGGPYLVLDGHVRVEVLREMGAQEATCLIATDDENCTYNQRVNRLAPIQEHRMIMKAIDAGVPEDRIARALNITVQTVRRTKSRLNDICPDAVERIKDKPVSAMALMLLKKVKPYRQIEMVDLMVMSNTYTGSYAKSLLAITPPNQLVRTPRPDNRPEQVAKLENEMRAIEREFVSLEESFGCDTLVLQVARSYLERILGNARIKKYLGQKHQELLAELQRVVEVSSLE